MSRLPSSFLLPLLQNKKGRFPAIASQSFNTAAPRGRAFGYFWGWDLLPTWGQAHLSAPGVLRPPPSLYSAADLSAAQCQETPLWGFQLLTTEENMGFMYVCVCLPQDTETSLTCCGWIRHFSTSRTWLYPHGEIPLYKNTPVCYRWEQPIWVLSLHVMTAFLFGLKHSLSWDCR